LCASLCPLAIFLYTKNSRTGRETPIAEDIAVKTFRRRKIKKRKKMLDIAMTSRNTTIAVSFNSLRKVVFEDYPLFLSIFSNTSPKTRKRLQLEE